MDETEKKKQVRFREPPSVPFLWELRPGFPSKDWKPEPPSSSSSSSAAALASQVPKPPTKLVTSIPFAWEEKPGKPIPDFSFNAEAKLIDMESSSSSSSSSSSAAASVSQVPKSPIKLITSIPFAWEEKPGTPIPDFSFNAEAKLIDIESSSSSSSSSAAAASISQVPKSPVKLFASIPFAWEEKPGTPISHFSLNAESKLIDTTSSSSSSAYFDEGSDIDDSVIGLEPESFGCSDTSLLANSVIASLTEQHSEQIAESSCPSPASENGSSTSSYETGRSSLVGASFLESLFPLFPPKTGFLEKAASSSTPTLEMKESRDFDDGEEEDNSSAMLRKPPTLGELIMMSRRRSYRRKAVQMSNWDLQRVILPPFSSLAYPIFFITLLKIS